MTIAARVRHRTNADFATLLATATQALESISDALSSRSARLLLEEIPDLADPSHALHAETARRYERALSLLDKLRVEPGQFCERDDVAHVWSLFHFTQDLVLSLSLSRPQRRSVKRAPTS